MKMSLEFTTILAVLILAVPAPALAEPSPSGLDVMMRVYNRSAPKDQQGDLTMTLTDKSGASRVRKLHQLQKDTGDAEKKIMFFLSPADVKNTSFMNWSYDDGREDDQWIYLPALRKIKRISSDSKSDYFMGSDFTYDDLGDRHPDKDRHRIVREETLDGEPCYVVESTPKDPDYMYSKTLTWVIRDKWIGLKREFFDEDGKPLKTLSVKSLSSIGKYFIIDYSEMLNLQTKHKTTMKIEDIQVDKGIPDSQFTERMMTRGL